jgi:hypothetical protein
MEQELERRHITFSQERQWVMNAHFCTLSMKVNRKKNS